MQFGGGNRLATGTCSGVAYSDPTAGAGTGVCLFAAGVFLELSRLLAYITDDGVSSREKQGGLHYGQAGEDAIQ